MKIFRFVAPRLAIALAWLSVAPAASAQEASATPTPRLPIERFTLANGLDVVVSTDRSTPLVAVNMRYGVGSAHEPRERSGLAHLLEHLYFGPTEGLGPGEFERMIRGAGGSFGGRTNTDRTEYTELVPSHHLDRVLWSHAQRMRHLVLGEDDFRRERELVREERRLGVDAQAHGEARLTLDTLAHDYAPYRRPVIGSPESLAAVNLGDAREFHDRWYRPSNATLVLVGDTSLDEVRPQLERHFGDLAAGGGAPPLAAPPSGPRTDGERRADLVDPRAVRSLVYVAWSMPPAGHPDEWTLRLLHEILAGEDGASRLRRAFARRDGAGEAQAGIGTQVVGQFEVRAGPGLFVLGALADPGVETAEVEVAIHEEILRLVTGGPDPAELRGAARRLRVARAAELLTAAGRAAAIQDAIAIGSDPEEIGAGIARIGEVDPAARQLLVGAGVT
ncbi:MAG: pitrilysin family protein, partial [Longimicrobiales bacterium]|nr:pitrilysin family protein [Longimicrobiales bacterium]